MLDTCICSFIMRKQPETVLKRLEQATCLVTALWSRPLLTLKCASVPPVRRPPRVVQLVDKFCPCLDAILSWDRAAVDGTTDIKVALRQAGTPIGQNDTAIAGPEAGRLGKLTSPTL